MGLKVNNFVKSLPPEDSVIKKTAVVSDSTVSTKVNSTQIPTRNADSLENQRLYGSQIKQKLVENYTNQTNIDFNQRTEALNKILTRGGFSSYQELAPYISDLTAADAKQLRTVYQQKTGRDLVLDVSNWLPLEGKYDAFKKIAPERIHNQPDAKSDGAGINMNPPTNEVAKGSTVEYTLNLDNEKGERTVRHLVREDGKTVVGQGDKFTGSYENADSDSYRVLFEVTYKGQPSEFYKYSQKVVEPNVKAENELNQLPGTSPDTELYQTYIETRIGEAKDFLSQLEAKKVSLEAEIQSGPTRTTDGSRNSSNVYDELRQVEKQIEQVKASLSELETSKVEMANVFSDSVGKPIPLKAVLTAKENGQSIPLQLYAKNLGGGKWAIIDATNSAKPRSYVGEGMLPTDALNQAWSKFVNGTNDLPAGQIAVDKPKGLGITGENTPWNAASQGQSTLKQFADGLGKGSLVLAGLGIGALLIPGGQGIGVALLLGSGVIGGISSGANAADRINNGTFKLNSTETGLDLLGVVGGLASVGGIAALTGAGAKGLSVLANGAKFNLTRQGAFTRIAQVTEQGTNVAGGILIANEYVSAMDKINKSGMSQEQKSSEIRKLVTQAVMTGGLIVLGVGVSSKLAKAGQTKNWKEVENLIGKEIKVGDKLPEGYHWNNRQIFRNRGM